MSFTKPTASIKEPTFAVGEGTVSEGTTSSKNSGRKFDALLSTIIKGKQFKALSTANPLPRPAVQALAAGNPLPRPAVLEPVRSKVAMLPPPQAPTPQVPDQLPPAPLQSSQLKIPSSNKRMSPVSSKPWEMDASFKNELEISGGSDTFKDGSSDMFSEDDRSDVDSTDFESFEHVYVPPQACFVYVKYPDGNSLLNIMCTNITAMSYVRRKLGIQLKEGTVVGRRGSAASPSMVAGREPEKIDLLSPEGKVIGLSWLGDDIDLSTVLTPRETYIPCVVLRDNDGFFVSVDPCLNESDMEGEWYEMTRENLDYMLHEESIKRKKYLDDKKKRTEKEKKKLAMQVNYEPPTSKTKIKVEPVKPLPLEQRKYTTKENMARKKSV